MSKEYGYIGKEVEQAFRSNKGIFTPQDIIELDQENKWTNFGQLELIQTQTISSSTASMDFTNIKETEYDTHVLFWSNYRNVTNDRALGMRLSEDNGTTFLTSSNYEYSLKVKNGTSESFSRSSGDSRALLGFNGGNALPYSANGYLYFFNLGAGDKYNIYTQFGSQLYRDTETYLMHFGSGQNDQAKQISGIRVFCYSSVGSDNILNLEASLYGIRSY